MKYKVFIISIILFMISWCSLVNEKKIEESENIDVKTFLDLESNTWEIIDNNSETSTVITLEEELEAQKLEEDIKKLIDTLFEE